MSADTTVVIAAYRRFGPDSELAYTADVVQAAENLVDSDDPVHAMKVAKTIFVDKPHAWFEGKGAFGRARQFANLLAQETRMNGILEYERVMIIEIDVDRIYLLSRKGNRKAPNSNSDWMAELNGSVEFRRVATWCRRQSVPDRTQG